MKKTSCQCARNVQHYIVKRQKSVRFFRKICKYKLESFGCRRVFRNTGFGSDGGLGALPKSRKGQFLCQKLRVKKDNKMSKNVTIDKQAIIKEYRLDDKDTGSCEVQVALLTARIAHLTAH